MVWCFCRGQPLPLPLGEVAERSEDGEGRHVKKICQWHIFSVDLSGYAAVASFLVCTASSFSFDRGGYAAVASIRTYTALSWMPSQSPAVTALPKGEPREGQSPSPTESLPHPSLASAGRVWYTIPHRWARFPLTDTTPINKQRRTPWTKMKKPWKPRCSTICAGGAT